ncbi:MAG: hypothetical protein DME86_13295 [Verrucomicrobia bacterium]|nr:MAG: hypothetical protein DME86_13295 [Verrucomicrobiota bacterium]
MALHDGVLRALHNGVLRRPELFGATLGEATEDGQRGQTRLSREPALDVGEVRIVSCRGKT